MSWKLLTPLLAAGALLCPAMAVAQTQPVQEQSVQTQPARTQPTQTPATASTGATPTPANINGSTTFTADNGTIVTVKSYQPSSRKVAPPPAFASLDVNGDGSLDSSEAATYPPLANDFNFADGNRNGSLSRSEYERWVKQP